MPSDVPTGALHVRDLEFPDGRRIAIRHATAGDAEALIDFYRHVGAESDNLTFGAEGMPRSVDAERALIESLRTSPNGLTLVATAGGAIVASLRFEGGNRVRTRHAGELGISVRAAWAGVGIGRALLECLIEWAERGGIVRKLDLRVRVDNERARRLYEAYGWRIEGRITRDLLMPDGTFHDAYYMGRAVDPPEATSPPSD